MNVIDDKKLQDALTGVSDAAVKGIATQVLPVVGALLDAAVTRMQESLGETLADVTAERQELISDIHGILDRLNGTKLVFTTEGPMIQIPPRKEIA